MSDKADKLLKSLELFDLEKDEASVFLKLFEESSSTPLRLSKSLQIPRTRVYRILEKLIAKGFVKEEIKGYGTKYIAQDITRFDLIIREKEHELMKLQDSAPKLFEQLSILQIQNKGEYKIQHYRGIEGLKQVTWNSLKTKDMLRIYEIDLMHAFLDYEFSEKVRLEFGMQKNIKVHQLTNKTKFENYTKIKEHVRQWEARHIDKKYLNINVETIIYNDIYCMYEYKEKDVFIVEIQNQKLADMQKQIFDLIWNQSLEMKKINEFGAAKVIK